MNFLELFTQHFYKFIITAFLGGVTYFIKKLVGIYRESVRVKQQQTLHEVEEQKQIKKGLLSLLRFRINRLYVHIKEQQFITLDEEFDLDDLYNAYSALGGNGETKRRFELIKEHYEVKDCDK